MKQIILVWLTIASWLCGYAQPLNDEPCGAVSIPVENIGCEPSIVYSYTNATYSAAIGDTYCIGPNVKDVWYKFIVPSNGEAFVSIAMNAGEFQIAVEFYKSTSCTGLSQVSIEGFPCLYSNGNSELSRTYKQLTPGSTAYLRVYQTFPQTPFPNSGSVKICVSNTNGLADDPCTAGLFLIDEADPLGQTCVPFKIFSWTNATLTPAVPNPSCGVLTPSNIRDVWVKVRVPASGKLSYQFTNATPETQGYASPFIAVYSASSCSGTFSEIYCGFFGSELTGLTPNSVIYFRIYIYSSSIFDYGSVKLCIAAKNSVPGINNSSKVGIGIDTPFAKLDVVGTGIFRDKLTAGSDVEVRGNLIVQGNITGKYGTAVLQGNTAIQGGPLKIDSLEIVSRLGNRISLFGGTGNTPKYGFGIQGGTLQMFSDAPASNIVFGYGNSYNFTERARIFNQGEFGMTLKGRLQLSTGTQSAGLWLTNTANTVNAAFIGMAADDRVGFFGGTGSQWALTMNTTSGNVGIGLNTANPTRPLSFPALLGEKILLYPGGTGEVGIGVYGNELRLHADNPGAAVSFGTQTNAGVFTQAGRFQISGAYGLFVNGSIWANGTTYASDERFKQNISSITSPLQKLLQLNGVEYEMRTDVFHKNNFQQGRQMGLLAQNVEKIIPEAVSEMDGYKGVDYARLVPLLVESIKAQQQQIDELKKLVETLIKK